MPEQLGGQSGGKNIRGGQKAGFLELI